MDLEHFSHQCAKLIRDAQRIVVLTGAGISTSAGIPDFRGPQGLYVTKQYDADTIFDMNHFMRDPKPFYDFARDFISLQDRIRPTFSHTFLAELEQQNKVAGIITQNIDSLHQQAGSQKVLEMHGSFQRGYCLDCEEPFVSAQLRARILVEQVPRCHCGGVIKPDIVFFGEDVKYYTQASRLALQADLFLVIGSSCVVYPAAAVPALARCPVVVVNRGPVELQANIDLRINADADHFFASVSEIL